MDSDLTRVLAERHDYDRWRGRGTLGVDLLVWRFTPAPDALPGWAPHRVRRVEAPGWPPSVRAIFRPAAPADSPGTGASPTPSAAAQGPLLALDIYETASRAAAHAFLLRLLGEFESPEVARQEAPAAGDVAFAVPGETALLFARANLVVLLRNAGRAPEPVTAAARALDAELVATPREGGAAPPEIRRFGAAARRAEARGPIALELDAADPLGRPLWYKFLSRTGTLSIDEDHPVYEPAAAGAQEVIIFAVNPNRGAASRVLQFDV